MMQNAVVKENETDYIVKSQTGNGEYRVSQTFKGFVCSCPDNTYRGWNCKHIYAVQFSQNLKQYRKARNHPRTYLECFSMPILRFV